MKEESSSIKLIDDAGTVLALWVLKNGSKRLVMHETDIGYGSIYFDKVVWEELKSKLDKVFDEGRY